MFIQVDYLLNNTTLKSHGLCIKSNIVRCKLQKSSFLMNLNNRDNKNKQLQRQCQIFRAAHSLIGKCFLPVSKANTTFANFFFLVTPWHGIVWLHWLWTQNNRQIPAYVWLKDIMNVFNMVKYLYRLSHCTIYIDRCLF